MSWLHVSRCHLSHPISFSCSMTRRVSQCLGEPNCHRHSSSSSRCSRRWHSRCSSISKHSSKRPQDMQLLNSNKWQHRQQQRRRQLQQLQQEHRQCLKQSNSSSSCSEAQLCKVGSSQGNGIKSCYSSLDLLGTLYVPGRCHRLGGGQ